MSILESFNSTASAMYLQFKWKIKVYRSLFCFEGFFLHESQPNIVIHIQPNVLIMIIILEIWIIKLLFHV